MPYSDFTNGSDSHTRGWGVKEGIFSYRPRIPKKPQIKNPSKNSSRPLSIPLSILKKLKAPAATLNPRRY